jgi:hypothetical protein
MFFMSEKNTKISLGTIKDLVDSNSIQTLKSIKTSMSTIQKIVRFQKQVDPEYTIYQESLQEFFKEKGTVGVDGQVRLEIQNNPVLRNEYIGFIMDLRNTESSIDVFEKPFFTIEELEEKGIELTTSEALIFKNCGILQIDFDLEDEKTEEEKVEAEVEVEVEVESNEVI